MTGGGFDAERGSDSDRQRMTQLRRANDEDVPALTSLVHAAYAEHGARGLNFTAVDQSEQTTRRRALTGASWVCESQGVIVATATYRFSLSAELLEVSSSARVPATGWLNQLAVHPDHRGRGHARALFRVVCRRAHADGVRIIGLDTAEPAGHLRSLTRVGASSSRRPFTGRGRPTTASS